MRITVGIPFRNAADTLASAVRSVFAQSFEDWELILVDDGSDDDSLELAKRVRDPRVRVIADGCHRGLPFRLNQIAAMAQAPNLARMDADDIMHPVRLERQLTYLDASPTVDVLGSSAYIIDEQDNLFGIRGQTAGRPSRGTVIAKGLFIHPTIMGRTAWFRSNAYDPAYHRAEDHELWARTFLSSNLAVLKEPLLFYRDGICAATKYAASCRTDRRIISEYGLRELGVWRTALATAGSHAKSLVYKLSSTVNLERWLLAGRNASLSADDRASGRSALEIVRHTAVPGLDR